MHRESCLHFKMQKWCVYVKVHQEVFFLILWKVTRSTKTETQSTRPVGMLNSDTFLPRKLWSPIVCIIRLVMHHQFVLHKVETVRLGFKWMINHFLNWNERGWNWSRDYICLKFWKKKRSRFSLLEEEKMFWKLSDHW